MPSTLRSTRPAGSGPAVVRPALVRCAAGGAAPGHRRVARADRHGRVRPAGVAGSRCESAQQPRAHPAVDAVRRRVAQRHRPRHGEPDRRGSEAAARQGRRLRPGDVLSGEGALQLAMAINNLLASPGFAAWMKGEPLDIQRLLFTAGRQAADRDHFDRASVGRGAHVLRDAAAQRSRRLDAQPVRHVVAARDSLHGRDLRLLPADRESAVEAADAHAAQAGRARSAWAACSRRRIPVDLDYKGLGERRHLVHRPAADRARQAARARRTGKRRARLGPRSRSIA